MPETEQWESKNGKNAFEFIKKSLRNIFTVLFF